MSDAEDRHRFRSIKNSHGPMTPCAGPHTMFTLNTCTLVHHSSLNFFIIIVNLLHSLFTFAIIELRKNRQTDTPASQVR